MSATSIGSKSATLRVTTVNPLVIAPAVRVPAFIASLDAPGEVVRLLAEC